MPKWVVLVLAVIAALLLCLQFFSTRDVSWDGFDLKLRLAVSADGGTRLNVPPVGSVTATTHSIPIQIEISLQEVELQALSAVLDGAATGALFMNLQQQLAREAALYVISLMLATGTLATGIVLAANLRHCSYLITAFAGGMVMVAVLASSVFATYNVDAFDEYALDGPVATFPGAFETLQQSMDQLEDLRRQMRLLGANLMGLYEQWGTSGGLDGFGQEKFSLLLVADVHNHVPALDFVRGMTDVYPVQAVVDLGDLTDWGTPVEARIVDQIGQLDVPYIFVPGNHETPLVVEKMDSIDNVVVLDGTYEMDGLVLAGFPDPSAFRQAPAEASGEEIADLRDKYRAAVRDANAMHPGSFVMLVAHHPQAVQGLEAMPSVRAVLSGHTHRLQVRETDDALHLDPGTTGASGVRGFMTESETPHTALLLHFSRDADSVRLVAVDSIALTPDLDNTTIKREIYLPPSP